MYTNINVYEILKDEYFLVSFESENLKCLYGFTNGDFDGFQIERTPNVIIEKGNSQFENLKKVKEEALILIKNKNKSLINSSIVDEKELFKIICTFSKSDFSFEIIKNDNDEYFIKFKDFDKTVSIINSPFEELLNRTEKGYIAFYDDSENDYYRFTSQFSLNDGKNIRGFCYHVDKKTYPKKTWAKKILEESIEALEKEGVKKTNIVFYYNLYERDSYGHIEKSIEYDSNENILFTNEFTTKELIRNKQKISFKDFKNIIDK